MLHLYTFGGLRIERDGQLFQLPTQKARDLLAYLITFRDRPHPRSALASVLWPNLAEERARRRLSDTLWRVRRAVGPDIILVNEDTIAFNQACDHWLDIQEFENKTQEAGCEGQTDPHRILHLASCIPLYRGPFLDGLYYDWVLLERERLRELYLRALGHLLERYKQVGDYKAALETAQQLVAVEPLHESAHRELMRLYHLQGRDAKAIAQYHRCREILEETLETTPAPETEALYHVLSRRVPSQTEIPSVHLPAPARRPIFDLDELPLVGRDAERAALLNRLEAAASGRGGIVLVEGEVGIGKSRLTQELIAGAHWRNIHVVIANADESHISSLYVPVLISALTPLRVRQLTHLVDPIHFQAAAPILPCIAQALPDLPPLSDLPPPQARGRLEQALIAIILGLARITPHLWVLEDIHWADAETLSLLSLLLPRLANSRTLFLLTGRSADLRAAPKVWNALQTLDRTGPFPRHILTRLDADAVGCLVRDLLGEEEPSLTAHLARESEGVPLYLVETLKAWHDEGHLYSTERGTWRWRGDSSTDLPSRLGRAVIAHRLSYLSPAAEELLTAAAVIGVEVDFDLLASVCAPSVASLDQDVFDPHLLAASNELLHLRFLVETDVGYRFSHESVRQTIYLRLSPLQRQRLHRRVALAVESLFPDQFELLAHHFAAAGERQPAVHYLTLAADRARTFLAHRSALTCYDRLLDMLPHPDDRLARYDVLCDRAEVLGWIGDREAQGRDLEAMLRLVQALADDTRLANALHLRSEWHRLQGRYRPAEEDALAALKIYRQTGDDRARAALLNQLGWNVVYTADYAQAVGYFQEALPIYRDLDDLRGQIGSLSGLINAAELDGNYGLALSYLRQNMALAEATGDPHRISHALHNTGVIYYDLGDMDAAQTYLQRALRLKESTGDRRSQALTRFYLGVMTIERGDFEIAQTHLDAALEAFREVQDLSWEGDALAALGRLALLQGRPDAAGERLRAAYQRRQELGEPAYAVIDLSYLSLAELALGDKAAAWQHSREAVTDLEAGLAGVEHPCRIYYNHFCVAESTRHWAAARVALEQAADIVSEYAERIDDSALREKFCTGHRVNRAIIEAIASQPPPGRLRVRLSLADAPVHRRPTAGETVIVIWTVDAGESDASLAEREGKVALRRHRLLRLLTEAEAVSARPTVADLAGGLDVSPRTVRADLAALRRQGHVVHTRGRRT